MTMLPDNDRTADTVLNLRKELKHCYFDSSSYFHSVNHSLSKMNAGQSICSGKLSIIKLLLVFVNSVIHYCDLFSI